MNDSKVVLTSGTENMSQAPFAVRNIRFGTKLGQRLSLEGVLLAAVSDSKCKTTMGQTAENMSVKYGITREEADSFAFDSLQKWINAQKNGYFDAEMAPVSLTVKKQQVDVSVDEHPRPQTTLEALVKLPTVFKKNGTVTAGNASVSNA